MAAAMPTAIAEHWVNVRVVRGAQELSRQIMRADEVSRIRDLLSQTLSFGDADSVAKMEIIGHTVDDSRGCTVLSFD